MSRLKLTEDNTPKGYHWSIRHYHDGNSAPHYRRNIAQTCISSTATGAKYLTVARLKNSNNEVVAIGAASPCSRDTIDRNVGREVAIGRALKEFYYE